MTAPRTWTPAADTALKRLDGRLFATVTEVSAILGYDKQGRSVRRGIEAGDIPAIKAGSTWRIPTSWLRKVAAVETSEA